MEQVISVHKTLDERKEEYEKMFETFLLYRCDSLKKCWSIYLQPILKPSAWTAMWKLSHENCDFLQIPFPAVVLVNVLDTCFDSLQAFVEVVAIQSDISIPDLHTVPLINLWPARHQKNSLSLHTTALSLDMLRFFYTKMFLPWDVDDGVEKWHSKHLLVRLNLIYDFQMGAIPYKYARTIKDYIEKAKSLCKTKEEIEGKMVENDDDDFSDQLADIAVQLDLIKSEFKLLEDPITRFALKKHECATQTDQNMYINEQSVWLVMLENTLSEHKTFLNEVKKHFANDLLHFVEDLNTALESYQTNDIIVLSPTQHLIPRHFRELFNSNIIIKGIFKASDTVLHAENEHVMIDSAHESYFENLTFQAENCQYSAILRGAKITLINCVLKGNGNNGIVAFPNGQIKLINCTLANFAQAVVGNKNCDIVLKNCKITNVEIAIKIPKSCTVTLEDCVLENCSACGLSVEGDSNSNKISGGFDLLKT